jgi:hypothetical protein
VVHAWADKSDMVLDTAASATNSCLASAGARLSLGEKGGHGHGRYDAAAIGAKRAALRLLVRHYARDTRPEANAGQLPTGDRTRETESRRLAGQETPETSAFTKHRARRRLSGPAFGLLLRARRDRKRQRRTRRCWGDEGERARSTRRVLPSFRCGTDRLRRRDCCFDRSTGRPLAGPVQAPAVGGLSLARECGRQPPARDQSKAQAGRSLTR